LPRARRLRQALERNRRARVRLRPATSTGHARRPRARPIPRARPLWRPMAAHQPRHRRHAIRGLIALVVAACIGWASTARAEVNFVPVPEIILDPNEGNPYGVMGVWMFLNAQSEIQYMVAPDIRYNVTKGVFPVFRFFGYPTDQRRYKIALGKSTTKDEEYEAEYHDRSLLDEHAFLHASGSFAQDSTERFW